MRYFSYGVKAPVQLQACGNLISRGHFLHHRRTFDQNVLILVLSGTLHITNGTTAYNVQKNEYLILPAGEEHYGTTPSEGDLSYLWVHFVCDNSTVSSEHCKSINQMSVQDDHISDPATQNTRVLLPTYGSLSVGKRVPLLFHQLLDFSRQSGTYSDVLSGHALSLLLLELAQEYENSTKGPHANIPPAITTIMSWIMANCHRPITIADIAEESGYNADYLSTQFKKYTGFTLIQYLNRSRIEISKNLLANNLITIKEAAYSSGFVDEKYYMKTFRKYEGITPTQYKNAFHEKLIN